MKNYKIIIKIIVIIFIMLTSIILTIGFIVSLDMMYRYLFPPKKGGLAWEMNVWEYHDYVVTTHHSNMIVAGSGPLQGLFYGGDVCKTAEGIEAKFNNLGFRSEEFVHLPPKLPTEIRIIITGGSASISWNVSENCTLTKQLEYILKDKYPDKNFKIYNLGSGAWKSLQELIVLERYAYEINPDIIIVFDGFNDIHHSQYGPVQGAYDSWYIKEAFLRYRDWLNGGALASLQGLKIIQELKGIYQDYEQKTISNSTTKKEVPEKITNPGYNNVATALHLPLDLAALESRLDFDPYNQSTVDYYLRNTRTMKEFSDIINSKVLFVLQPALCFKWPMSDDERRVLVNNHYDSECNYIGLGYLRISKSQTKYLADMKNAEFLDLKDVFNNKLHSVFYDNVHFGPEGYKMISGIIANKIIEMIKK